MANILVNFKSIDMEVVLEGGLQLLEFMKTSSLVGTTDVVIADLGFAKQLDSDGLART